MAASRVRRVSAGRPPLLRSRQGAPSSPLVPACRDRQAVAGLASSRGGLETCGGRHISRGPVSGISPGARRPGNDGGAARRHARASMSGAPPGDAGCEDPCCRRPLVPPVSAMPPGGDWRFNADRAAEARRHHRHGDRSLPRTQVGAATPCSRRPHRRTAEPGWPATRLGHPRPASRLLSGRALAAGVVVRADGGKGSAATPPAAQQRRPDPIAEAPRRPGRPAASAAPAQRAVAGEHRGGRPRQHRLVTPNSRRRRQGGPRPSSGSGQRTDQPHATRHPRRGAACRRHHHRTRRHHRQPR